MSDTSSVSTDTVIPAPPVPDASTVVPNGVDPVVVPAPPAESTTTGSAVGDVGQPSTPPSSDTTAAAPTASPTSSATAPVAPPAPTSASFAVGSTVAFDYDDPEFGRLSQVGIVISSDDAGHLDVAWYTGVATLTAEDLRAL